MLTNKIDESDQIREICRHDPTKNMHIASLSFPIQSSALPACGQDRYAGSTKIPEPGSGLGPTLARFFITQSYNLGIVSCQCNFGIFQLIILYCGYIGAAN